MSYVRSALADSQEQLAALPRKTCKDGTVVLASYPCKGDAPNAAFAVSGTVLLMIGGIAAMVFLSERGR